MRAGLRLQPAPRLAILVALVGLAFALRAFHLGRSPLRGDEAFAIRYWAVPPAEVLDPDRGLAWVEPHPFGTYFLFWAWKSLVGDGEFGMRMLPALLNLLGVPAMWALGRRLLADDLAGLAAAFLWAVNPNLLWHSQDARNYAIWAALSAVALWLLSRAVARSRRTDWLLYSLACALALYVFFIEAFIVIVHGLYVLLVRHDRFRAWVGALLIVAVLLLPWVGQVAALAGSGYQGTAAHTRDETLWRLYGALAFGETLPGLTDSPGSASLPLIGLFAIYLIAFVQVYTAEPRAAVFLTMLFLIPMSLLSVASLRLDVFSPKYLIATTPAILLPLAYVIARILQAAASREVRRALRALSRPVRFGTIAVLALLLGALGLPTVLSLAYYYSPGYHKAPDWHALRDYLQATTTAADTVIVSSLDPATGVVDPAFEYYYPGPAKIVALPYPGLDIDQIVQREIAERRAVWFVVSGVASAPVNEALLRHGLLISDDFPVRQYRSAAVKPEEIDAALDLRLGGAALRGYGLTGTRRAGSTLTVLLFWQGEPHAGLKTFVHLVGPARSDGSPLWSQHDHAPAAPGRDVYRLDLGGVPPGEYTLLIGLYDPAAAGRVPITDAATGAVLGDSYPLATIRVLP